MTYIGDDVALFSACLNNDGRLIAIDYGAKHIGLAQSDPGRGLAFPRETYVRRNARQDVGYIADCCLRDNACGIVVGMPYALSGEKTETCLAAERFAQKLVKKTGLPALFCDERLSTVSAKRSLSEIGLNKRGAPPHDDAVAASLILRQALALLG